ncbi:MAG: hypothetical protein SFZ24_03510 [Planctomycetota bacterium]|nr:hypothetical protein [Planctomycetota bacterium]
MSLDDRQQQIQVGAGLQESRLNTDLIAWLEKYGTWILSAVLVVVAGYVGYTRLQQYRADKLDQAFAALTAAAGQQGADGVLNGSPDNLLRVAEEHKGQGSIAELARLNAAEIYLGSARRGLRPGADLAATKPEDVLKPDEVTQMVQSARGLFDQVVQATSGKADVAPLNLRARWGQVAAAMSAGQVDQARTMLSELAAAATKAGFPQQAAEATKRAGRLDAYAANVTLLSDADLPAIAASTPEQLEQSISIDGADLDLERMPPGFVPPGFEGSTGGPAPAPAEAPPASAPQQTEPAKPAEEAPKP